MTHHPDQTQSKPSFDEVRALTNELWCSRAVGPWSKCIGLPHRSLCPRAKKPGSFSRQVQLGMSALPPIATTKATTANRYVCLTPESGQVQCKDECRLRVKSGHCDHYSINLSARSSSVSAIVRPRALAVLRLMIKLNLVGS
jgi:hypothetical protein